MRTISFGLTLLLCASGASATEWHVYGTRAMGMGGAGVAASHGPLAAYWNPAALGRADKVWGVQAAVSGHGEFSGSALEGANDLNQISKDCQVGAGFGTCNQANIDAAIGKINQTGSGARGDLGSGAAVQLGRIALFFNNLMYLGARPIAQLGATPANIATNQSKLQLRGAQVFEMGVGYGQELPFAPGVSAGANLKGLVGRAGYHELNLATEDPGSGELDRFTKNARTSMQPALDVGLLWDVARTIPVPARPRLGLTVRNANNPKFKNPDAARAAGLGDKHSLHGQARAGASVSPLPFWHVAADMDLTRNLTELPGVKSQMMGVGTELNIFNRSWLNIPLRAGLSQNIAHSGSKTSFSTAVGLHFLHVHADVAAALSPATQSLQSQGESRKIPSNISVAAQLGIVFGAK